MRIGETAALLGCNHTLVLDWCRRGRITAGRRPDPGEHRDGFLIGWREVERLIRTELDADDHDAALRRLLAVRAGALRFRQGELVPETVELAPTDTYTDDDLLVLVRDCSVDVGSDLDRASVFDDWCVKAGLQVTAHDICVRLRAAWRDVVSRVERP
jgi:hypothetical protein